MTERPIEYCDLVMKGGITSGIVYPNAVIALSKRYHFKNIGGTSAGAIAAAAAAAAALGERRKTLRPGRRKTSSQQAGLSGLSLVAGQLKKSGFIFKLFQPVSGGKAAFKLLVKLAEHPGATRSLLATMIAILAIAPVETLLVLGVLLGIGWWIGAEEGIWAALLPTILCALAAGGIASLMRVARVIRRNAFGLCSGAISNSASSLAITDWLHSALQSLAGQGSRPLIFQDLWDAPRYPGEPGHRALSLEVITTGISHHEPRRLPFENSVFWFEKQEFSNLFPRAVVNWMMKRDRSHLEIDGKNYYRLPEAGQLPVLVATRMSLSFPLLLSAVPLYEGDFRREEIEKGESDKTAGAPSGTADEQKSLIETSEALTTGGERPSRRPTRLRKCWFSDGGISSNFPIHLFDASLPRWPTFAIDLIYPNTSASAPPSTVFLPKDNNQGWQRRYSSFESKWALAEVSSFLFTIIATMQNWRDLLQSRAPGHRDRIVRVPLAANEGGMNLNMPQAVLDEIAVKGTKAGTLLMNEFNFNNHWWIRWRNVASAMERFTISFAHGAATPLTDSYAKAHASARTGIPKLRSYKLTGPQQSDAQARFQVMEQQGLLWDDTDPDLTRGAPKPLPQLRITPIF